VVPHNQWAVEHPVLAQLMFWRPVPAFVPSAESFAASSAVLARFEEGLRALVERDALHPDATTPDGVGAYTAIVSGVISQHLANHPDTSFVDAHDPALIELLTGMFLDRFAHGGGRDNQFSTHAGGRARTDIARGGGEAGDRATHGVRCRTASA
jgi:hypothetical protein